ncbi:NADH dehydrogenase 1 alpha subcomplex [Suillus spraguei]|nr:NADH dehydrogenase 1 alpha subcomplex [Suillus spraguei]
MSGLSPQTLEDAFEPKPALRNAATIGLQAGIVGAFVSAVQNALGSHSRGAAGFLTRSGGTIGTFAAMGAAFAFTESAVANQRETNDALNGIAGGCAAGFLAGLKSRSIPVALGSCAVIGAAMGTFDYAGEIAGRSKEQKEEKRKKFFKPVPQPSHHASE